MSGMNKDVSMPFARGTWRLLAAGLILAAAGLHILYLSCDCPLDLAPDEAHYWDWSRHLDWSYYSKGPLVAYLIRAGQVVTEPWADPHGSCPTLAVRLPAVCCGSLLLAALYVLTVQVYRSERLATAVVALALTLPVLAAGSTLMTIDAPYTCCWAWALVLGHQALVRGKRWAWPGAGLLVGLGILAKYTMLLWLPSAALFLLTDADRRRLLLRPGFGVLTGVAAVCCLPILLWNAQHNWVSFHHVGGQAGLRDTAPGLRWQGPLEYLGIQFLLLLGFWFVAWAAALITHRPGCTTDPSIRYLWWMSVTTFVVFFLFSLKTREEPNWPVAAYLAGLVLATAWIGQQLRDPRRWYRRVALAGLASACGLGLTLTAIMHHSEWVQPLLARLSGTARPEAPLPLRRFDPTCRLRGWRTLAAAVDRIRDQLRAEGVEAEVAGSAWTLPGELAYYCHGQPTVYSLGLALGDRHSQYDWWHPQPLTDSARFMGRTFVVVGDPCPALHALFDDVDPPHIVSYEQAGQPLARWTVNVCRGFRGWRYPAAKEAIEHF
jgi:hypothetical protein